jgi:hypothetical protein
VKLAAHSLRSLVPCWLAAAGAVLPGPVEAGAGARPTSAALRKAFEQARRSVVEVRGPRKSGAGVLVGRDGHVLTSVDFVGLEEARVVFQGKELQGRTVMASAPLKAAVVAAVAEEGGGEFPAAAVQLEEAFREGTWLVAAERGANGQPHPRLVQVYRGRKVTSPFVEVNAPLPNGTPLFDPQGRLVAMAVQRRRRTARALPMPEVKVLLAQAEAASP